MTAAGVDARQQIATAQSYILSSAGPFGDLIAYGAAVNTGGPLDIKNLQGHSPQNLTDVAAGNISFGITCPFGTTFCQVAAGLAQGAAGLLNQLSGGRYGHGANWYAYDGEGRICAVQSEPYNGGLVAYAYIYDAEGRRVGKGTITPSPIGQQPSCNMSSNNFNLTESYVLGQNDEQLTTLTWSNGASTWQSTNVYGEGKLLATYDAAGLHFQLTDPLGTRRVQTNSAAEAELDCQSLPFGDQQSCFPDPNAPNDDADEDATGAQTPIHFTNKQHDTESGNDYFGARYYSSTLGRFLSPDWSAKEEAIPYSKLDDPQSLNLYAYVGNNPLTRIDADGHDGDQYGIYFSWVESANEHIDPSPGASLLGSPLANPSNPIYQAQQQNSGQPAPTNPDGSPKSPQGDVPDLPPGKGPGWKPGDPLTPNEWVPGQGSNQPGGRDTRWGPKYPIPGQSQPGTSWDPDGHWDYDPGTRGGGRTRWLPDGGGQVDHYGTPVQSFSDWVGNHRGAIVGAAIVGGAILLAPETGGTSLLLLGVP